MVARCLILLARIKCRLIKLWKQCLQRQAVEVEHIGVNGVFNWHLDLSHCKWIRIDSGWSDTETRCLDLSNTETSYSDMHKTRIILISTSLMRTTLEKSSRVKQSRFLFIFPDLNCPSNTCNCRGGPSKPVYFRGLLFIYHRWSNVLNWTHTDLSPKNAHRSL